jgi:hypothetical protein
MTWATVVFVSKRGTWIVAQEFDEWIVLELVDDEGSIQICDEIRGGGKLKAAKRHLLSVPAAPLRLISRADSCPSESRSRKQNSGAVTKTREAPAPRFQAIARVYVSVFQN